MKREEIEKHVHTALDNRVANGYDVEVEDEDTIDIQADDIANAVIALEGQDRQYIRAAVISWTMRDNSETKEDYWWAAYWRMLVAWLRFITAMLIMIGLAIPAIWAGFRWWGLWMSK